MPRYRVMMVVFVWWDGDRWQVLDEFGTVYFVSRALHYRMSFDMAGNVISVVLAGNEIVGMDGE